MARMDLNTILTIVTLIVLLLGILGGVLALGRKDQQVSDLVAKAGSIEASTESISERIGEISTAVAVQSAQHAALEKRVSAIEDQRGGCRLPHDHERG